MTDIVIIGAGIIGLSSAFQLVRRTSARILVLEKGAGLGEGSTGASSSVCRFRYSHEEMIELARDGIGVYQHWPEFLETAEPVARYHQSGVLWFDDDPNFDAEGEVERLKALRVRASVLDVAELQRRFPYLNPCILAPDLETGEEHDCVPGRGYFFEDEGGYVEPTDALEDLARAVRARGVDIRFNARVDAIRTAGGRAAGVTLADGSSIDCDTIVNASGPWCNDLLSKVGLSNDWPLTPTRIQIAQVDLPAEVPGTMPVCGDIAAGIYFRPQGRQKHLIVGSVLPEDEREAVGDPDHFNRSADDDFVRAKLHALQHRLPGLQELKGVRSYSGLYTMNVADVHPVVGKTPIDGLLVANGCSGHGFKLAPAIGSLIAQAITGDRIAFDTAIDPAFLGFGRKPIALARQSVLA